jgi:hypothetical protein
MKKYVDGKYVEMTAEEIEQLASKAGTKPAPSVEERLEALEYAMLEQILGGADNV